MTLVSVGTCSGAQRAENTKQTTLVSWCQKSGDCCHMYVCTCMYAGAIDRNRANHLQSRDGKQAASDLTLNSKKVRGLTAKLVPVLDLRGLSAYPSPDLRERAWHAPTSTPLPAHHRNNRLHPLARRSFPCSLWVRKTATCRVLSAELRVSCYVARHPITHPRNRALTVPIDPIAKVQIFKVLLYIETHWFTYYSPSDYFYFLPYQSPTFVTPLLWQHNPSSPPPPPPHCYILIALPFLVVSVPDGAQQEHWEKYSVFEASPGCLLFSFSFTLLPHPLCFSSFFIRKKKKTSPSSNKASVSQSSVLSPREPHPANNALFDGGFHPSPTRPPTSRVTSTSKHLSVPGIP